MRLRLRKSIVLLDLALLAAVLFTLSSLVGSSQSEELRSVDEVKIGDQLNLPTAKWDAAQRHLVLVYSPNCFACRQSVPFYKRLYGELASRFSGIRMFVVSARALPDDQKWWDESSPGKPTVVQVSNIATIGVRSTPTILLVDGQGTVTDIFSRTLGPAEETRLLAQLEDAQLPSFSNFVALNYMASDALPTLLAAGATAVDVRDRSEFSASSSLPKSRNIPADEVGARLVEFSPTVPVVLDCRAVSRTKCEMAAEALHPRVSGNVHLLTR